MARPCIKAIGAKGGVARWSLTIAFVAEGSSLTGRQSSGHGDLHEVQMAQIV